MSLSIYQVRCRINNKVYIGKTSKGANHRWKDHIARAEKGKNGLLCQAIRKYGSENFDVWVLYTDAVTEGHLNMLEQMFIKQFKSNNSKFGYNLTEGGDGIANPSREIRTRHSKFMKGRPPWNKGKKMSKEFCQKMGELKKGNKNRLGIKNSKATRKKISKSNKRYFSNPKHRRKTSRATRKAMWNPEIRRRYLLGISRRGGIFV